MFFRSRPNNKSDLTEKGKASELQKKFLWG
jgi:hypothetical protein